MPVKQLLHVEYVGTVTQKTAFNLPNHRSVAISDYLRVVDLLATLWNYVKEDDHEWEEVEVKRVEHNFQSFVEHDKALFTTTFTLRKWNLVVNSFRRPFLPIVRVYHLSDRSIADSFNEDIVYFSNNFNSDEVHNHIKYDSLSVNHHQARDLWANSNHELHNSNQKCGELFFNYVFSQQVSLTIVPRYIFKKLFFFGFDFLILFHLFELNEAVH